MYFSAKVNHTLGINEQQRSSRAVPPVFRDSRAARLDLPRGRQGSMKLDAESPCRVRSAPRRRASRVTITVRRRGAREEGTGYRDFT